MQLPRDINDDGPIHREDIDRLRGLAVLSVIAFHFEANVHGGYVGVDIFFVISGFLITQIIQRDLRAGTFSFVTFYERRVRRLLPALYLVVLASIVPAFVFLLTSERIAFFRSIAAVVTFTSNIVFWSQSGYFDRSAVEKPLLHTWSLAVEEQFYLVFPALIWLILLYARRCRRPELATALPLLAMLTASFVLGLCLLQAGHSATAFYMSPARAWEFLIGSIIAVEGFPVIRNKHARNIALGGAYVLLLVPIFGLRQSSLFPGWNALMPCLGAAMFIWSGTGAPATPVRHRYSPYRLARFFGTISYSMYLWHWPLFTFARFAKDGLTLSATEKVLLFAATVAASYLSWKYVEQPFRQRRFLSTQRLIFLSAAAGSVGLIAIAVVGVLTPTTLSNFDRTAAKLDAYNRYDERAAYRGACFKLDDKAIDEAECLTLSSAKTNVMLWGDSHAAHYYPGLVQLAERTGFNIVQATQAGCTPTFHPHPQTKVWCRQFADLIAPWFVTHRPDIVIVSGDWIGDIFSSRFDAMIGNIRRTTAELNAMGIKVVVIGPAIQFKTGLPDMLIRKINRRAGPLPVADMLRADIFSGDTKMKAALPDTRNFRYISVLESACPDQRCPAIVGDDVPLTWDYGHLTVEGSEYVVQRLRLLNFKEIEQP